MKLLRNSRPFRTVLAIKSDKQLVLVLRPAILDKDGAEQSALALRYWRPFRPPIHSAIPSHLLDPWSCIWWQRRRSSPPEKRVKWSEPDQGVSIRGIEWLVQWRWVDFLWATSPDMTKHRTTQTRGFAEDLPRHHGIGVFIEFRPRLPNLNRFSLCWRETLFIWSSFVMVQDFSYRMDDTTFQGIVRPAFIRVRENYFPTRFSLGSWNILDPFTWKAGDSGL
jgi:hypothetical protein